MNSIANMLGMQKTIIEPAYDSKIKVTSSTEFVEAININGKGAIKSCYLSNSDYDVEVAVEIDGVRIFEVSSAQPTCKKFRGIFTLCDMSRLTAGEYKLVPVGNKYNLVGGLNLRYENIVEPDFYKEILSGSQFSTSLTVFSREPIPFYKNFKVLIKSATTITGQTMNICTEYMLY